MTNLIGRPAEEIESLVAPHTDRPFRSRQVAHWILQRHATSFDDMTNLPADLRRRLGEMFVIDDPEVVEKQASVDGSQTVSYTHLTLPTTWSRCRSRWSPFD